MRARSFAVTLVGLAALLVVRPSVAGQDRATTTTTEASLGHDVQRVKQDVLMLVSAGLSRLGLWAEATAVSRQLLAEADDPFDACIAQAAVVWQTSEALGFLRQSTLREWEKLSRMASDIESTTGASSTDVEVCRAMYRRVTGHVIDREQRAVHCGRHSVVKHYGEKLLPLYVAYLASVAPAVAADRAAPRR